MLPTALCGPVCCILFCLFDWFEVFSPGVTGRNFPPVSFFPGERMGRPILSPGKTVSFFPTQFFPGERMGRPILSPGKKLTGEKTDRYTGQQLPSVHLITLFSWASLTEHLTSSSCTYFRLQHQQSFLNQRKEDNYCRNYFMINLHDMGPT